MKSFIPNIVTALALASSLLCSPALLMAQGATATEPSAQEAAYTLEQCQQMALKNNSSIKIAKGSAQQAHEVKKEAFTKYFPTIEASGLAMQSNKHFFTYNVLDLFNIELVKKGLFMGITAVQPVFAGGQIINGNKLAGVGAEVGDLQYEQAKENVALTVEQYYWELATLKAKRHTLESFIQTVDSLEHTVQVALDAGLITRNELLKVRLKKNELLSLMVDLDNGIQLSKQLLGQYIGQKDTPVEIIDEPIPEQVPPIPYDIYQDRESALPSTIDYQLLDKQVKATELERRMAVGANMPTVGIGAGYYYDDILNQHHTFGAAFIAVSVPISGWWGGSHSIKKAKLAEENAKLQREDLGQMLQLKMSAAWDDLTSAQRKMVIAHQSIGEAKENFRMSQVRYQAGLETITDLLDAQSLYRQSIDQYTEAYGNFRLCRAKYLNSIGQN